jgi:TIR domain
MSTLPTPPEIFYSYARADEPLRIKFEQHLGQLLRQGLISGWHDRQIMAGTDWTKALDSHLNTSSVILLLISPDFFASDYSYGIEMERALERHKTGEAHVIPILLRHVNWQDAPFGKLQALPSNGRPIADWRNRDDAFFDVIQGVRKVLELLTAPILPTRTLRDFFISYSSTDRSWKRQVTLLSSM